MGDLLPSTSSRSNKHHPWWNFLLWSRVENYVFPIFGEKVLTLTKILHLHFQKKTWTYDWTTLLLRYTQFLITVSLKKCAGCDKILDKKTIKNILCAWFYEIYVISNKIRSILCKFRCSHNVNKHQYCSVSLLFFPTFLTYFFSLLFYPSVTFSTCIMRQLQ